MTAKTGTSPCVECATGSTGLCHCTLFEAGGKGWPTCSTISPASLDRNPTAGRTVYQAGAHPQPTPGQIVDEVVRHVVGTITYKSTRLQSLVSHGTSLLETAGNGVRRPMATRKISEFSCACKFSIVRTNLVASAHVRLRTDLIRPGLALPCLASSRKPILSIRRTLAC